MYSKVVIAFGGSTLFDKNGFPSVEVLKPLRKELEALANEGVALAVVVGGGKPSRMYVLRARELGLSDGICDLIAIAVTRVNAMLLSALLGKTCASLKPPSTIEEAVTMFTPGKVLVMGGTEPGQTTDAVAAKLAECSLADLLVLVKDVGGIYTDDPKVNPNATLLKQVTISRLKEMVSRVGLKAATSYVVDPVAIEVIGRSSVKTVVTGYEPGSLLKLVKEGVFKGTEIIRG